MHNPNWPEIPDHPYRMLIIDALKNDQSEIDKIYLWAKNLHELKYHVLINNHNKTGIEILKIVKKDDRNDRKDH